MGGGEKGNLEERKGGKGKRDSWLEKGRKQKVEINCQTDRFASLGFSVVGIC